MDCLVHQFCQKLRYLRSFNNFVKKLEQEEGDLILTRDDVQNSIEHVNGKTRVTSELVNKWLQDVMSEIGIVNQLLEEARTKNMCCFGYCPNLIWRYRIGKKLANKAFDLEKFIDEGKKHVSFGRIATLPSGTLDILLEKCMNFESRQSAYEQLLDAVKNNDVSMIGLYGMGGCGKTTLAMDVMKLVEAKHLFEKVLFVPVSCSMDVWKIQEKIASSLQFKFPETEEMQRAQRLSLRLTQKKNIFIILDDVWEKLDFGRIGIPSPEHHKGCKILITSRSEEVCTSMDCQRKIYLPILTDEEAWTLFQNKALISEATSDTLKDLGRLISNECKGLPVAIAAVACSLKGKAETEWSVALNKLKHSEPINIERGLIDPYKCLQLSYDNLDTKEAKSLFLLCSVFPKDSGIPVETLTRCAIGLGVVGETLSYEEARSEVIAAKIKLVSCCLLLIAGHERVKMHDIVRDVAHIIAQNENKMIKCEVEKDVTVEQNSVRYLWCAKISKDLDCSNLEFLCLRTKMKEFDGILKRMGMLKVLIIDNDGDGKTPLPTISFKTLTNLRCLSILNCELSDFSFLRGMKNLQSLELYYCLLPSFPQLQSDVAITLTNLKLLELNECDIKVKNYEVRKRIPLLEELYIIDIEGEWDANSEDNIEFFKTFSIPETLQRYGIVLGSYNFDHYNDRDIYIDGRTLLLNHFDISNEVIKGLAKEAKDLYLGNIHGGAKNMIPDIFQIEGGGLNELNKLEIRYSQELECLIDINSHSSEVVTLFCKLHTLIIEGMENLKTIWNCFLPANGPFENLEKLDLSDCPRLTFLFTYAVAPNLVKLKILKVSRCDELKHILTYHEKSQDELTTGHPIQIIEKDVEDKKLSNLVSPQPCFPKLEALHVDHCQKLKRFFSGSDSDDFPNLHLLAIKGMDLIMIPNIREIELKGFDNARYLFKLSIASLLMLEILRIEECGGLEHIIDTDYEYGKENMKAIFPNLRELSVRDCGQLKYIGEYPVANQDYKETHIHFSPLETLHLSRLPCFVSIYATNTLTVTCPSNNYFAFLNLGKLEIIECDSLEVVFSKSVVRCLPKLNVLVIRKCNELRQIIEGDKNLANLVSPQPCFPKLEALRVDHCHKLKRLFSGSASNDLPNLHLLAINGANELEELVGYFKNTELHSSEFTRIVRFIYEDSTISGSSEFTVEVLSKKYINFESRQSAQDQLLDAVKNNDVSMIGLYGMGGCGKTTLAMVVKKFVKAAHHFEKILFVPVSSKVEVRKIQEKIASSLEVEFQETEEMQRAQRLCSRLIEEKNIFIILDDVWEKLDFGRIGIPSTEHNKDCKILITSRSEAVCTLMDCQKKIYLPVLTDEEAWTLFQTKAFVTEGTPDTLKDVGRLICNDCKGLPIAIAAVASSLKGKAETVWSVSLNKLRHFKPINIERGLIDPYKCLQLSYDNLDTKEAKSLFLLCSVFPKDCEIKVEDLTRYAIGLGVVGEVDSYEEARSEVIVAKIKLVTCCLLSDADNECVKMHDVVRDVAHIIAKNENKMITCEEEKDVIVGKNSVRYLWCVKFPNDLDCSNLEFLYLVTKMKEFDGIFKRMGTLKVLILVNDEDEETPLSTITFKTLTNLRYLFIENYELSDFSFLGDMKNLQSLELFGCSLPSFPELQTDVAITLTTLKLLELNDCDIKVKNFEGMKRIPLLEELYIIEGEWDANSEDNIEFFKTFSFPETLQRYGIVLGSDNFYNFNDGDIYIHGRTLLLNHFDISNEVIKGLAKKAKDLFVGNIDGGAENIIPDIFEIEGGGLNELNKLEIRDSKELECLIDTSSHSSEVVTLFSNLEKLDLSNCRRLKFLFTYVLARNLVQLKILKISRCRKLEHILTYDEKSQDEFTSGHPVQIFQNLQDVKIKRCRELKHIFPANIVGGLTQLKVLRIEECDKLEQIIGDIVPLTEQDRKEELDEIVEEGKHPHLYDTSFPTTTFVKQSPGTLSSLGRLKIKRCGKLGSIFTASIAKTLTSLEELFIEDCESLKDIVTHESIFEDDYDCQSDISIFQSLKKLHISECDLLEGIFPVSFVGELNDITNKEAADLKDISSRNNTQIELPALQVLELDLIRNRTIVGSYDVICPSLRTLSLDIGRYVGFFNVNCSTDASEATKRDFIAIKVSKFDISHFLCHPRSLETGVPWRRRNQRGSNSEIAPLEATRTASTLIAKPWQLSPRRQHALGILVTMLAATLMAGDGGDLMLSYIANRCLNHLKFILYSLVGLLLETISNSDFVPPIGSIQCLSKQPHGLNLIMIHNIREIALKDFDKARYLFKLSIASSLMMLEILRIEHCGGLEYIIETDDDEYGKENMKAIFPNLKKLSVDRCYGLEYMFGQYDVANNDYKEIHIQFSALEILSLNYLPNFVSICSTNTVTVTWPSLKDFECYRCLYPFYGSVSCLTIPTNSREPTSTKDPKGIQNHLPTLQTLYIKRSDAEHIFCLNEHEMIGQQVSLRLKYLSLEFLSQMTYIWVGPNNSLTLQHLTTLEIRDCGKLEVIFPSCVLLSLPELKCLTISECMELKQIMEEDESNILSIDGGSKVEEIIGCDKEPSNNYFAFPNLKKLEIIECAKLEVVFQKSVLRCLPKLKLLMISKCKELRQIIEGGVEDKNLSNPVSPQPCFPKLEALLVDDCHKLKSCLSESSSNDLPNLQLLVLNGANELEELVGCKQGMTKVELPRLKLLILMHLENFSQEIELHNLKNCIVYKCPKLSLTSTRTLEKLRQDFPYKDFINTELDSWEFQCIVRFIYEDSTINGSDRDFTSSQEIEDEGNESIESSSTGVEDTSIGDAVETHIESGGEDILALDSKVVEQDDKMTEGKPGIVASQGIQVQEGFNLLHKQQGRDVFPNNNIDISSDIRTRLGAYKHFVDLDDAQISLLVEAITSYPHLWNASKKFSDRFQAWRLKILADMLSFLQKESVHSVIPQREKEFYKLCEEAIFVGFESSWVEEMRQRVVARDPKLGEDIARRQIDENSKRYSSGDVVEEGDGPKISLEEGSNLVDKEGEVGVASNDHIVALKNEEPEEEFVAEVSTSEIPRIATSLKNSQRKVKAILKSLKTLEVAKQSLKMYKTELENARKDESPMLEVAHKCRFKQWSSFVSVEVAITVELSSALI
ncbi:hypothetical protein V8G54_004399 [Vigna mungo]|uniref:AAA+ ATPase domain-containing protein n=1 Tax=Vigna mungo TaxID=3915 RepID=A0AAQ3PE61_VIGMU